MLSSADVAVIPTSALISVADAVTPSRVFSSVAVAVTGVPLMLSAVRETVPLNVGLAVSALVLTAVAILSNSVSNSVPLMTFCGSPLDRLSLGPKAVVLM